MTAEQRLEYHQEHSKEPMAELKTWMQERMERKLVEPSSGLGAAITYTLKHWGPLTCFLNKAGAPLDNNICERAIKKVVLSRKNSYFYKTQKGAIVGDLYMGLIHTCQLNKINPYDYLVAIQENSDLIKQAPEEWLPLNYKETMAAM